MNLEKDFYQDVDTSKKYNWWRLFIVFFWILVIMGGFSSYYFYNLIRIKDNLPAVKVVDQDAKNIDEVINFAKTNPSFSEPVTITQNELTSYLFLLTEKGSHDIKNLQAKIEPSKIILSGRLLSPVDTTIHYELVPVIDSGKVRFDIESLTIGQLKLSKRFVYVFGKKYVNFINNSINQPENLTIRKIDLVRGAATILGKFKGDSPEGIDDDNLVEETQDSPSQ